MGSALSAVSSTLALLTMFRTEATQPTDSHLINTVVDCRGDYAYEGRFRFLENKGEAYWHLESDRGYFEYYFPSSCWVGIAASNQFVGDEYYHCVDCYHRNQGVGHCLAQCVGDNVFVATSKGDDDPDLAWHILEFAVEDKGGGEFNQFQIAPELSAVWGLKGTENASFHVCLADSDKRSGLRTNI